MMLSGCGVTTNLGGQEDGERKSSVTYAAVPRSHRRFGQMACLSRTAKWRSSGKGVSTMLDFPDR